MQTPGQEFYSSKAAEGFTRQDVLNGQVIKINPALITIIDGLVDKVAPDQLQRQVTERVEQLLAHRIQSFHVDVNYEDYGGFGSTRPDLNQVVFTPQFLQSLNQLIQAQGAYLNLHLLTDFPLQHVSEYANVGAGAICFQLDSIANHKELAELVDYIQRLRACASPVIETIGTENLEPLSKESVLALLEPLLPQIGMLTFQAAATAARSNKPSGQFAAEQAGSYISFMKQAFSGTIQIQGGMTTQTIGEAVKLGADFIVCGSEIFRNREGRSAERVIDELLQRAADGLEERS